MAAAAATPTNVARNWCFTVWRDKLVTDTFKDLMTGAREFSL